MAIDSKFQPKLGFTLVEKIGQFLNLHPQH